MTRRRTVLALGLLPAAALSACADGPADPSADGPADPPAADTAGSDSAEEVALAEERASAGDVLSVRIADGWRAGEGPGAAGAPGSRVRVGPDGGGDARPAVDLAVSRENLMLGVSAGRHAARADVVEVLDVQELPEESWPALAATGDRLAVVAWVQEVARVEHFGPGEPTLSHILQVAVLRVPAEADPGAREEPPAARGASSVRRLVHVPGLLFDTEQGPAYGYAHAFLSQDAAEGLTGAEGIEAMRAAWDSERLREVQAMLVTVRVDARPGAPLTWDTPTPSELR